MVKDIDGAWFGNAAGVPEALKPGATAVVSTCRMGTAGVEHLAIALIDTTAEDNSNLAFVLADKARTIVELVDEGERVFVYCVAAENRTPAMAAAYLMARGIERQVAIERAATEFGRRPQAFLLDGLAAIAGFV